MKLTKEQEQEIKDLQSQENKTKRVVAPELEKIIYDAIYGNELLVVAHNLRHKSYGANYRSTTNSSVTR